MGFVTVLGRKTMKGLLAAGIVGCCTGVASGASATQPPELVIADNDFLGPGATNMQAIIPLLGNPHVQVLGFSVVVGDGWENASAAHLLRLLEIAKVHDIPVLEGATTPLINSRPRLLAWEKSYGTIPWKGAWRGDAPSQQPPVPELREGAPSSRPSTENAALFMIRQVHLHPHQVTIMAAGPLTNLALAIRLDPQFASLAKRLIFMGGIPDGNLKQVTDSADYYTDFNLIFDPEAADITLTADWPDITCVGTVSNEIRMTPEILAKATTSNTKFSDYLKQYYHPQPMWDELTAAITADPSLITQSVDTYMDVDLTHGPNYGYSHVWSEKTRPHTGERMVHIVTGVDTVRFFNAFTTDANRLGK